MFVCTLKTTKLFVAFCMGNNAEKSAALCPQVMIYCGRNGGTG